MLKTLITDLFNKIGINPEFWIMSKPFELTNELLLSWIRDAVFNGIGYIKVGNYGGNYAMVEHGIYTVTKQKHTVVIKKTREAMYSIFVKLVNRYLNFERNGYQYHYHNGTWRRTPQNTVY